MPAAPPPLCLVWGPPGHGVTDYGDDVAAAARARDGRVRTVAVDGLDSALRELDSVRRTGGTPRVHVHVTDRLFGRSPEEAAETLERLVAGREATITLHDVPQHSDGTMYERRVAAYRRFIDGAAGFAVNSDHERRLLSEHAITERMPAVIPLGTRVAAAPAAPAPAAATRASGTRPRDLTVLIAGYVYPGKGHEIAIDAAAAAVADLRAAGDDVGRAVVRALGGASPGHDGDLDALRDRAAASGAVFEATGFLSNERFAAALRDEGVPVAAHEHVSASRSILDWAEAGRRALFVDSRYAREAAALRPGAAEVFARDDLAAHLAAAWRDPDRTWLEAGHPLHPTLDDAAAQYLDWWAR